MKIGVEVKHYVMKAGDEDRRYRITVLLIAAKRPRYFDFHCIRCGNKICELSGQVAALYDSADLNATPDYQPAPVMFECTGRFCRTWYEFASLS